MVGIVRNKRESLLFIGFAVFSYVLLSAWGALVAENLVVLFSERRLVACAIGAGLFWCSVAFLKRRGRPNLTTEVGVILAAGLTILAVRLGLDQLSPDPVDPQHSIRWSLAWSGYFGIWLMAVVPPARSGSAITVSGDSTALSRLPEVYLEAFFDPETDPPE